MNFLLHRHLALAELDSERAAVGAMLPDLWRMAHRRARARRGEGPVSDPAREVLCGVAHHLEADRWFHALAAHHDGEERVASAMEREGCSAPRGLLLAHATWEMCLDGALVRRVGLRSLLEGLRAGLDASAPFLREAARACGLGSALGDDEAAFEARLARLCAAVGEGTWVAAYQSGEGLAACVDGIRRRLGLAPLDEAEREKLARALEAVAPSADRALEQVLLARSIA